MVKVNQVVCPKCGGELNLYGGSKRIVRTKGRKTKWIKVRRLKCSQCGMVHRELPDYLLPYKQYELDLIKGVLDGIITSDTLGYEDYPCELTMKQWRHKLRFLI
mgnify:CR=1 FL=1